MGSGGGGGGGGGQDNSPNADAARTRRQQEKARERSRAIPTDTGGSSRDPSFGAKAPAPQMGRSPAAFQAMLGSTGQGAKDAAALAGRSEFGSASNFNALGKMVSEARGETNILIPSATTAGAAIAKRKTNEAMLQKIISGGKPVFKDGNIVGVDEDGKYTGLASASPYATEETIEQATRDEPVTVSSKPPVSEDTAPIGSFGRLTTAGRGTGRRGVAFGSRRSLVNLRSLGKRGLG